MAIRALCELTNRILLSYAGIGSLDRPCSGNRGLKFVWQEKHGLRLKGGSLQISKGSSNFIGPIRSMEPLVLNGRIHCDFVLGFHRSNRLYWGSLWWYMQNKYLHVISAIFSLQMHFSLVVGEGVARLSIFFLSFFFPLVDKSSFSYRMVEILPYYGFHLSSYMDFSP